jgi:tellurite resistance protein
MPDALSRMAQVSRILEDRFFFAESLVLKEQLARLKKTEETEEALSRVSGIVNKDVLRELIGLRVRPEILSALCLVPIIEVAWADGKIEEREYTAIIDGAKTIGLGEDHAILQEWLKRKPDEALMAAWQAYMTGLCDICTAETLSVLKEDIIDHAYMVAKASGGFLGLADPISPQERAVLDSIAAFFGKPGHCWSKL